MSMDIPLLDLEAISPEPVYVDDVGWEGLLDRWNAEVMEGIERIFVRFGIEPNQKVRESLKKKLENAGLHLPPEIFSGGTDYPPRTDAERSAVERKLRSIAEAIPQIKQSVPTWPKVFEWEALLNGGLRYPAVSAGAIQATEQRLGIRLPPSYRNFLMVSNGWLTDQEIFLPVEQIDSFQKEEPELAKVWTSGGVMTVSDREYFEYDLNKQDIIRIRVEYLPECLLLSEHYGVSTRYYLLNPAIIFENGEWEAWSLEPRIAGALRFRSFKALMEWLYMETITELRSAVSLLN